LATQRKEFGCRAETRLVSTKGNRFNQSQAYRNDTACYERRWSASPVVSSLRWSDDSKIVAYLVIAINRQNPILIPTIPIAPLASDVEIRGTKLRFANSHKSPLEGE